MRFSIVTAFPEFFRDFLASSVVGRAIKAGLFEVETVDLRAFGKGGYRQIDDYAFGSGGMVLMAEPLKAALDLARSKGKAEPFVVYPSPQGIPLTQELVETLVRQEHVVIVCGHYEGVDERFVERCVDAEVSVGDCVLTGGEIPAMALVDAVSRLIPGVVGRASSVTEDSFYRGMLDHPHYTRPASWKETEVPEVLLSGNASEIEGWRRAEAVRRTLSRRPDLLSRCGLGGYTRGGVYPALVCTPEDAGRVVEWAELCGSYGAARLLLSVSGDREPFGRNGKVKLFSSFAESLRWAEEKEKKKAGRVLRLGVSDREHGGARHWLELKRLILEEACAAVFYFGDDEENLALCDLRMIPLQGGRLPLTGKIAAVLDRFLGMK
jgi:tRNA (guanine37-N1)-methyltransferase